MRSETTVAVGGSRPLWTRAVDRAGSLFRPAPPAALRWPKALLAAVAVGAGTIVSLARPGGVPATDSIWAEDGSLFLADAASGPAWPTVVEPYNGYFQVLPRLLALPLGVLPVSWAAAYLAVAAAAATAAFALVVYVASAAYLPSRLARGLVAAVPVVVPVGTTEIPNSICNLHWAGLYALFWMLLWLPGHRAGKVVALVLVPIIAATNILAVALVPLALLRLIGRRDRHSRAVGILTVTGVVAHVVGLASGVSTRQTPVAVSLVEPVKALVTYVVPAGIFGDEYVQPTGSAGRYVILAWATLAAAIIVAVLRASRPNWRLAGVALGTAGLLWLLSAGSGGLISRYGAAPAMLLVTALVALVLPRPGPSLIRRQAPILALAAVLVWVWTVNYRLVDHPRGHGPRWSESVAAAREQCAGSDPDTVVLLPISPTGWTSPLPCRYVLG